MSDKKVEIVYFDGQMIRIIKKTSGNIFVCKDICNILGLTNVTTTVSPLPKEWVSKEIVYSDKSNNQEMLMLSFDAIRNLLYRSRNPKVIKVVSRLQLLLAPYINTDIEIISHHQEANYIGILIEAFQSCNPLYQFSIGKFRIDLYLPEQKIAIECDEGGHKNRDSTYEISRNSFIESQLGCTFVRFNPDKKDFNIGTVINTLIGLIYKPVLYANTSDEEEIILISSATKTCRKCKEMLSLDYFKKHNTSKDGYSYICKNCSMPKNVSEKTEKRCSCCKETKKMSEFNNCSTSSDGKFNYCRPCNKIKSQKYKMARKKRGPTVSVEIKKCANCKTEKNITNFWNHPSSKDGKMSYCKECSNQARRDRLSILRKP